MEVWIGDATPLTALTELSRTLPYRLVPVRKGGTELAAAISRAYAQQEGSAASVVDEVDGDARPVAADAGAAGDRGPARGRGRRADHPHDQRAADAGRARRRVATSTSSPTRRTRRCASASTARCARWCEPHARAARGAGLAHQDHGRARHRREAPAAGRPHHAAHRRPRRSTCASRRCRPAHGERAVLRLLDKEPGEARPRRARHERRHAGAASTS